MICGARNFEVGDLVVVVKPGAVLPGDFQITARETYGRVSNGMICSARELALSDDHSGIIVLPAGTAEPGVDAIAVLGPDRQGVVCRELTKKFEETKRGSLAELSAWAAGGYLTATPTATPGNHAAFGR